MTLLQKFGPKLILVWTHLHCIPNIVEMRAYKCQNKKFIVVMAFLSLSLPQHKNKESGPDGARR